MNETENKINEIIEHIKQWFDENGNNANAIIGISGGKDSTVATALCVKALGKDRVIGVLMPNGEQPDIDDSKKVVEFLGIKHITVNINDMYNAFIENLKNDLFISDDTKINLPPRIRMSVLYAIAQSCNGRVINTCNRSEDYVGYSTKYGDSA
ncbi:MAG: NAD(+) synthase, partial [Methanosphaera sp.]|nr:NAD(+) synthase [Methanosphaera sp.]